MFDIVLVWIVNNRKEKKVKNPIEKLHTRKRLYILC